MSWTYINYCKAYDINSGASLNGDAVLNVQAGDLLVAICEWYENNANPTVTISDGGSNSLTMLTKQVITSPVYTQYGYKIAASANASAQFVLTFSSNQTFRTLIILQFRPSAGTVTLDVYDLVTTTTVSAAVQTDNIITTGIDELVIGGHGIYGGSGMQRSISDTQISDVASDGCPYTASYYCHMWYKVFTSTQSVIHAQGTLSGSATWNAGILSFKLEGGSTIVALQQAIANLLAYTLNASKSIAEQAGNGSLLNYIIDIKKEVSLQTVESELFNILQSVIKSVTPQVGNANLLTLSQQTIQSINLLSAVASLLPFTESGMVSVIALQQATASLLSMSYTTSRATELQETEINILDYAQSIRKEISLLEANATTLGLSQSIAKQIQLLQAEAAFLELLNNLIIYTRLTAEVSKLNQIKAGINITNRLNAAVSVTNRITAEISKIGDN